MQQVFLNEVVTGVLPKLTADDIIYLCVNHDKLNYNHLSEDLRIQIYTYLSKWFKQGELIQSYIDNVHNKK